MIETIHEPAQKSPLIQEYIPECIQKYMEGSKLKTEKILNPEERKRFKNLRKRTDQRFSGSSYVPLLFLKNLSNIFTIYDEF